MKLKLQYHRFRFGISGNLKVLICRIFGHRVNNDPTGFTCQRCRLAYEEIYYPADYWKEMIQFMKPKPENVEAKELVSALVDELTRHTWFPGTERQVDLFERCSPYIDIPDMPESLNHPPILDQRMKAGDKVTYTPTGEKGRVKSVPRNNGLAFPFVFVVFSCGGDWENFDKYTGVHTPAEKLAAGWNNQQQPKKSKG